MVKKNGAEGEEEESLEWRGRERRKTPTKGERRVAVENALHERWSNGGEAARGRRTSGGKAGNAKEGE